MNSWNKKHEWEIIKTYHERHELKIFLNENHKIKILMAIKKFIPQYHSCSFKDIEQKFKNKNEIKFNFYRLNEVTKTAKQFEKYGVFVEQINVSFVTLMPFDKTDGAVLLIENEAIQNEVIEQMLKSGIPFTECQA